ncbi:50S ribosomal protein L25/general stress protein Ctc [Marinicella sp. S1101]|uniref:50S ribosomal protein L25/general stress protein Ctc n=1 Tax=Marinicella marina TaxID=2996016 RepID=UPI002260D1E3|nr:50S ribosomal protein L25/general stress protein Ctc [Marinicella marina]MCX7552969.1 50S ribosomal protein L25/general stress protein Ctc [Marinicella marina]MDJ1139721.1 50S ribosomal protein L25/general stress protein Ctc [Marinicella marina]
MAVFKVEAELRDDVGKGASRRLRHAGLIPVVLYGGDRDPRNLTLEHNKVLHMVEDEAFFSSIIEFSADGGKKQKVVLKDVQRHPSKPVIMHMDFLRVNDKQEITMQVPLHFLGGEESPAGKSSKVMIDYQMNEVEIICLPGALPEYIEVDVAEFSAGDNLHLSDIKLPEGVALVAFTHGDDSHDAVVVSTSAIGQVEEAVSEDEAPAADEVEATEQSKDSE